MWDLLENQKKANGSQHAANDRRRKIMRNKASFCDAKSKLQRTGQDHCCEEYIETQFGNGSENNDVQSCRRTTHRKRRATEETNDDPADHSCDQPGNKGRPTRQRNAHAKGQRNEKHNDTGRHVLLPILQIEHVL